MGTLYSLELLWRLSEAETVMYTLFGVGLALLLALLATIVLLCNEKSKKAKWEDNDSYDMKENGVKNASFKKDESKFQSDIGNIYASHITVELNCAVKLNFMSFLFF